MKVLITGANGFIGSHLTKELAKKHDVYCLVRASSNLHAIADENINIVFGDLHNKTSLRSVVKDVDYIFHLAGNKKAKNEKSYYDDNFIGTKNLLETIISERIKLKRFVFISSLSAYGPSNSLSPKVEDGIKEPVDAFGESKLQAQQYVQFCSPKVPSTIVVAPIIYGPGDLEMLTFFNILRTG